MAEIVALLAEAAMEHKDDMALTMTLINNTSDTLELVDGKVNEGAWSTATIPQLLEPGKGAGLYSANHGFGNSASGTIIYNKRGENKLAVRLRYSVNHSTMNDIYDTGAGDGYRLKEPADWREPHNRLGSNTSDITLHFELFNA